MVLKSNSYEEGVFQSYKVSVVFYDEEHTEWPVEQNSISGVSLPGGSDSKESAHDAGDPGSISGEGRSPGEGSGNPLQYSCLENSMGRGAWRATVHSVTKSWT